MKIDLKYSHLQEDERKTSYLISLSFDRHSYRLFYTLFSKGEAGIAMT